MSPTEINQAVARKLGWTHGWGEHGYHECFPYYCTSIEAAWEIVEKMPNGSVGKNIHGRWVCSYGIIGSCDYSIVEADTAPMAICLAFLNVRPPNKKAVLGILESIVEQGKRSPGDDVA